MCPLRCLCCAVVQEMLRLNVFKGASELVNAEDLVGRCRIAIQEAAEVCCAELRVQGERPPCVPAGGGLAGQPCTRGPCRAERALATCSAAAVQGAPAHLPSA